MRGVQGGGVTERRELSSRGLDPYSWVLLGVGATMELVSSEDRVRTGLTVVAVAAVLAIIFRIPERTRVFLEGTTLLIERRKELVQIPVSAIRDVQQWSGWRHVSITVFLDESANFGTKFTFTPQMSWNLRQPTVADELRRLAHLKRT